MIKVEKKAEIQDELVATVLKFNQAVFDLGLTLIEDYRAGNCRDSNKTLDAIIEIFKMQPTRARD